MNFRVEKNDLTRSAIEGLETVIKQIKKGEIEINSFSLDFDWFPEPGTWISDHVDPICVGKTLEINFKILRPYDDWPVKIKG